MFDKVLSWFMYGWTALALALEALLGERLAGGAAQMVRCIQPGRARPAVAGHRRVHLAGEASPAGAAASQAINRARRVATPTPPRRASRAWWRQNAQRLARRRRPLPRLRRGLGATFAIKVAPQAVPPTAKGRTRSRLPVTANTALATAGPIGATPGSPMPVGASDDDTICTSTFGISSMRST
jgi:hypothetical protein